MLPIPRNCCLIRCSVPLPARCCLSSHPALGSALPNFVWRAEQFKGEFRSEAIGGPQAGNAISDLESAFAGGSLQAYVNGKQGRRSVSRRWHALLVLASRIMEGLGERASKDGLAASFVGGVHQRSEGRHAT